MQLETEVISLKNVTRLANSLLAKFDSLDLDRDGYVTREDLKDYAVSIKERWIDLSEKLSPTEAVQVAQIETAISNIGLISQFSNDEWGRETSGISRQDLVKLEAASRGESQTQEAALKLARKLSKHEQTVQAQFDQVMKAREFDRKLILTSPGGVGQYPQDTPEVEPEAMPNAADRVRTEKIEC